VRRLSGVAAIAMSFVTIVGALPASAATYHASLGNVSATLTYQGTYPTPKGTTITISRAGHIVYRGAVSAAFCGKLCWPASAYGAGNASPLRVVRLEAGSPDVVLGLYSGGAHCCFIDEVFAPSSATRYAKTEINLGDPGARIEALPGNPYAALVTADDSFAYAFTDFAASGLPIKVMRFSGHGFINVTRRYPKLIRSDAANWLVAFYSQASSHYSDSVGVIAAWAADEYLLGRANAADQFLDQQAAAGHLHSLLNPSQTGVAFVAELEKFLQHQGY
jgi:hypothetical protein